VPDEQTALALLSQSAGSGFVDAQHLLATLHERGEFLPASQSLALKWYRLAAEQGDADSQLALATQYFLGRGTEQDFGEAARWYGKAAEAGDEGAQYILASMYDSAVEYSLSGATSVTIGSRNTFSSSSWAMNWRAVAACSSSW
jgi:TPR repeat protein